MKYFILLLALGVVSPEAASAEAGSKKAPELSGAKHTQHDKAPASTDEGSTLRGKNSDSESKPKPVDEGKAESKKPTPAAPPTSRGVGGH